MTSLTLGPFRSSLLVDDPSCQFPADVSDIYWCDYGSLEDAWNISATQLVFLKKEKHNPSDKGSANRISETVGITEINQRGLCTCLKPS